MSRKKPQPKKSELPLLPILDVPKLVYKSSSASAKSKDDNAERGFLCKIRFRNDFPPLPCEPKFLQYPMDHARFTRYTAALDNNYKFVLHTEPDLGIPINLIEPDAYNIDANAEPELDPKDEELLRDDDIDSAKVQNAEPDQIPWLRKTTYLSADYSDEGLGVAAPAQSRSKRAQQLEENEENLTLAELMDRAERTFDVASQEPVHPTNPSLKPVQILPVLPDFELWANRYSHFIFDEDPAHGNMSRSADTSRAILQVADDVNGVHHLSYFLPCTEARPIEGGIAEGYRWIRQYSFQELEAGAPDSRIFIRETPDGRAAYHKIQQRSAVRRAFAADQRASHPTYTALNAQFVAPDNEELEQRALILQELSNKRHRSDENF